MRVGSHVSIRGGYLHAAKTAVAIGAGAFQYFPKNPRSLIIKQFDQPDAEACAGFCREKGLVSVAHTSYPVNLAVGASDLQKAVIASLRNDLYIAEACGSAGVVVHFGKSKEKDPLQGYKNIIQCLQATLSGWEGSAKLLLENQAGEGSSMGTTLEELVNIRKLSGHSGQIGFCLDTCHLFASGVWREDNWAQLEAQGAELGYFDHLEAVHLNDSAYPSGSGKDRHTNIGKGYIGEERFRSLLASSYLQGLPLILETASGADQTHKQEITYVKTLQS